MHMSRICGAAGVALMLAVATATASASPTAAVDRECYLPGQTVQVTGSGFTASGAVRLTVIDTNGGGGMLDTQAGPDGTVAHAFRLGKAFLSPDTFSWTLALAVSDQTLAEQGALPDAFAAVTAFSFSDTGAAVDAWDDRVIRPKAKTRFRIYGMNDDVGKQVYAHYLRGGKAVKSVALGQLKPPCGDLNVRKRQFAFKPVPAGLYRVVFNSSARYSSSTPSVAYAKRLRVSARYAVE